MKYQAGFKFMSVNTDYEIITFLERHNMYLVKNYTEGRQDELIPESQIDNYINDIENIKVRREKNRIFLEKQSELERLEKEKQEAEEREYNNSYGYADKMSPMAKGKTLKILNTKENYYDKGVYIGTIARKDFIKKILESGGTIEHKTNLKYWSKQKQDYIIKANEYRLCLADNTFYEINKTEFDYATYLINKRLQEAI